MSMMTNLEILNLCMLPCLYYNYNSYNKTRVSKQIKHVDKWVKYQQLDKLGRFTQNHEISANTVYYICTYFVVLSEVAQFI